MYTSIQIVLLGLTYPKSNAPRNLHYVYVTRSKYFMSNYSHCKNFVVFQQICCEECNYIIKKTFLNSKEKPFKKLLLQRQ